MLLSLTVLSELCQEKLVTRNEVKRMRGEGGYIHDRVVSAQCTKPPEVLIRTADILNKFKYTEIIRKLTGW